MQEGQISWVYLCSALTCSPMHICGSEIQRSRKRLLFMHETEVFLHFLLNPHRVKIDDTRKRKVSKAVLLNEKV